MKTNTKVNKPNPKIQSKPRIKGVQSTIIYNRQPAIVVGYVNDVIKPYLFNTITSKNKQKVYVSINNYTPEEVDPHLYMTLILGYHYDKEGYYYYRNANAKLYSYEVIQEPIFYSNILDSYTHVIHSKDIDWDKTLLNKLNPNTSLLYLDSDENSHWVDTFDPNIHIELINGIKLNRMINYVNLDLL